MTALHPLSLLSTRRLWTMSGCCVCNDSSKHTGVDKLTIKNRGEID